MSYFIIRYHIDDCLGGPYFETSIFNRSNNINIAPLFLELTFTYFSHVHLLDMWNWAVRKRRRIL